MPLPESINFPEGAVYSLDHVPDKKPAVGEQFFVYSYNSCQTALELERTTSWRAPNYKARIRKAIKQGRQRPLPPCHGGNHACTAVR